MLFGVTVPRHWWTEGEPPSSKFLTIVLGAPSIDPGIWLVSVEPATTIDRSRPGLSMRIVPVPCRRRPQPDISPSTYEDEQLHRQTSNLGPFPRTRRNSYSNFRNGILGFVHAEFRRKGRLSKCSYATSKRSFSYLVTGGRLQYLPRWLPPIPTLRLLGPSGLRDRSSRVSKNLFDITIEGDNPWRVSARSQLRYICLTFSFQCHRLRRVQAGITNRRESGALPRARNSVGSVRQLCVTLIGIGYPAPRRALPTGAYHSTAKRVLFGTPHDPARLTSAPSRCVCDDAHKSRLTSSKFIRDPLACSIERA